MRQIIAGNWKMNGQDIDLPAYAAALVPPPHLDLVICPPFPFLGLMKAALAAGGGARLGAQDCHARPSGAHTGDVSAPMLKALGVDYVILGHSERRADHRESNAEIAAKAESAIAAGLIPIVCVGETEAERDSGQAEQVVRVQVELSLPASFHGVVAYEPIWAIGTGRTPTEDEVAAMHANIRAALRDQHGSGGSVPILYGGSVKPSNAAALLALPEVGGALVGGASLEAADLMAIANAAPAGDAPAS